MSQQVLTLELPKDTYEHVRRAARGMKQSIEEALVKIVEAATPSLEKVPSEYRAELESMEDLSDAELWKMAANRLPPDKQRRLTALLRKHKLGELSDRERQTLIELRRLVDRLMLRRSYAYLLLKFRGHRIPNMADLGQ